MIFTRSRPTDLVLDQRIARLHRAREAVIERHKAYVFLIEYASVMKEPDEIYCAKYG